MLSGHKWRFLADGWKRILELRREVRAGEALEQVMDETLSVARSCQRGAVERGEHMER